MTRPTRQFSPYQTKRIVSHLLKHGLTKGVSVLGEKGFKLSVPVAMRVAKENKLKFPKGRPVKGKPRATVKLPRKKKSDPAPTPAMSQSDEAIMKQEVKENLQAAGVLPVTPVFVPEPPQQVQALSSIDNILKTEPLRDDPNQPDPVSQFLDIIENAKDEATAKKELEALETQLEKAA